MGIEHLSLGRMVAFISVVSGSISLLILVAWLSGNAQRNYNMIINAEIEEKGDIFLSAISANVDNTYGNLWALTQNAQFRRVASQYDPDAVLAELLPIYQQHSNRGLELLFVLRDDGVPVAQVPATFPYTEFMISKIERTSRRASTSIIETGTVGGEKFSVLFSIDIFHPDTLKNIGTLKAIAPLAPPAELLVDAAQASKVACHATVFQGEIYDLIGGPQCLAGLQIYADAMDENIHTPSVGRGDRQFLYGTKQIDSTLSGNDFAFIIGSETGTINILRGQLTSFSTAFGVAFLAVLLITVFLTQKLFQSDLHRLLEFVKSSPDTVIQEKPVFRVSEFQRVANAFHVARERLISKELEKLAANQNISQLNQRLSEAQSQKMNSLGVLTSGVAHDFNNIIAVMMSALDQQDDMGNSTPDIPVIRHSADRASQVVKKLLAFSHQEDTKISAFLPATEIQDLISIIEPSFGSSYKFAVNVETPLALEVGRDQFCSSMMNLAINARDAMPGGGTIEFTVRPSTPEEIQLTSSPFAKKMVSIAISDTGPGIPPHVREQIFEPFYTTKPVGQGTGLGLSMAMGFAKGVNGALKIGQSATSGAQFIFILPCSDSFQATHAPAVSKLSMRLDGMRILVADDEEALGKMIIRFLQSVGADVDRSSSVSGALERIRNSDPYHAIVTDLNMPDGLGTKVVEHSIHTKKCPVQFVIMSGNFSIRSCETLSNGTMLHRIPKPFRLPELVEVLTLGSLPSNS